jgi:hypothetical protein
LQQGTDTVSNPLHIFGLLCDLSHAHHNHKQIYQSQIPLGIYGVPPLTFQQLDGGVGYRIVPAKKSAFFGGHDQTKLQRIRLKYRDRIEHAEK